MDIKSGLDYAAAKSSRTDRNYWLPFHVHAMDTGNVCLWLAENWLSEQEIAAACDLFPREQFPRLCRLLGMLHDLGKLTSVFQSRILPGIEGGRERLAAHTKSPLALPDSGCYTNASKTPHAAAGEGILTGYFENVPFGIAIIVGSHHGAPPGTDVDDRELIADYPQNYYWKKAEKLVWTGMWKEWFLFSLKTCGYSGTEDLPQIGMQGQVLLTGLLIMADWIASNEFYFPLIPAKKTLTEAEIAERAEKGLARLNLPVKVPDSRQPLTEAEFEKEFGFKPNALQQAVLHTANDLASPGLLILEAQMGVGKTEAALAAAEVSARKFGAGGLYFGLPTQATANGIFTRVRDWAQAQSTDAVSTIRLAHGMAKLNEDYLELFQGSTYQEPDNGNGLEVHPWFEGSRQALLADYVIGTVDQFLMAALKVKHNMLRHLGLAGKIVVIDECHAYDAYMNRYLDRALEWMGAYHVPVILLSATLPAARRAALVRAYLGKDGEKLVLPDSKFAYPLITQASDGKAALYPVEQNSKKTEVKLRRITAEEIAGSIRNKLAAGGCAGVIVNTVARAQELKEELAAVLPDFEIQLLHARFTMLDRAERETAVMKRIGKKSTPAQRDHLIVIGTQVLEQSLDIDFDFLITELCPMDLLLQRIGRLHRHTRVRPEGLELPECAVVVEESGDVNETDELIYHRWPLLRTLNCLPDRITLPTDIPRLVESVYQENPQDLTPDEEKSLEQFRVDTEKLKAQADIFCVERPERFSPKFPRLVSLAGWLNVNAGQEAQAEASVRAGEDSLEVLVVQKDSQGGLRFLPWVRNGEAITETNVSELAKDLQRQKLRLPHALCMPQRIAKTSAALAAMAEPYQFLYEAGSLRNEQLLILDDYLAADINGYHLVYSRESGLYTVKGGQSWNEN